MKCPQCSHEDSRVIDSRGVGESVRRRRQCLRCGYRFTTYEHMGKTNLLVIKKDGRREEFDRNKIVNGIRKACAKRPISIETIERMADEIEKELNQLGKAEVPTSAIGELVMERLRKLDHIAYIRFASVYRQFADIEDVEQELEALARAREPTAPPAAQLPLLPNEEVGPPAQRRRHSK